MEVKNTSIKKCLCRMIANQKKYYYIMCNETYKNTNKSNADGDSSKQIVKKVTTMSFTSPYDYFRAVETGELVRKDGVWHKSKGDVIHDDGKHRVIRITEHA